MPLSIGFVARYCGTHCQRIDWNDPGNHRTICKHIQARRRGKILSPEHNSYNIYMDIDGVIEPISKRDQNFMRMVAFRDTTKYQAHIRGLKAKCLFQNPTNNLNLLVIDSDYTTVPLNITVKPVEHYRPHAHTSDVHACAQYDDLVERVIKDDGKSAIQLIAIPRGVLAQRYWVLRPVD
jgi:hypothetical protein